MAHSLKQKSNAQQIYILFQFSVYLFVLNTLTMAFVICHFLLWLLLLL